MLHTVKEQTAHIKSMYCTVATQTLTVNLGVHHHTQGLWGLKVVHVRLDKCRNNHFRPPLPLILLLLQTTQMHRWIGFYIKLNLIQHVKHIRLMGRRLVLRVGWYNTRILSKPLAPRKDKYTSGKMVFALDNFTSTNVTLCRHGRITSISDTLYCYILGGDNVDG